MTRCLRLRSVFQHKPPCGLLAQYSRYTSLALSPSSSAMELDERAHTLPPMAPLAFVSLMDYPWLLHHEMPTSMVFLKQWCLNGLRNGVPASALECLIQTETAPMTAAEKRQVPKKLCALKQAVDSFALE